MSTGGVAGFHTLGDITDPLAWAKKLVECEEEGEILSYYQREIAYSALGLERPPAPGKIAPHEDGGED